MGARTPKTADRRVQRTHRTLRQSLISLMLERGWDDVSVQDVCEHADVGRSTFYMHFADKEDLLVAGFNDLRKAIREQLAATVEPGQPLPFARGMIEHACEHQRLFKALVGRRSGQVVLARFRTLVLELVREDLNLAAKIPTGVAREVASQFITGGFLGLLTWWIEERQALPPAEIERWFLQMATPALRALQGAR